MKHRVEIIAKVRACDAGGFIPVIERDGREHWNWRLKGYDRRIAAKMAREEANEEAGRYIGDWDVVIKDRTRGRR